MLQIMSHPLGKVFEAMIEKRQDQIPDEGFLMTKKWGVNKGQNTETVCVNMPYIAVKNTKGVINGNKFRIMSMFFL